MADGRCQVSGGDRMNKAPVNEIGAQNDGLACSQTPELKLRLEDGSKGPLRLWERYKQWLLKLPVNGDSGAFLKVLRNRFNAQEDRLSSSDLACSGTAANPVSLGLRWHLRHD